jgi:hypothetical protein
MHNVTYNAVTGQCAAPAEGAVPGATKLRQAIGWIPSASARADSAPRRFRCGSLLPAADSAHKYPIGYFLRQGCRRALVRWVTHQAAAVAQGGVVPHGPLRPPADARRLQSKRLVIESR